MPGHYVVTFAVRTDDNVLTAHRVVSDGETEEAGRWVGVDCGLVGNFAQLTTDQLLIIYSDSEL